MIVGFGLLGTFIICYLILIRLDKNEDKEVSTNNKSYILYNANSKDTYTKARDVFYTLENAKVTINFLNRQDR